MGWSGAIVPQKRTQPFRPPFFFRFDPRRQNYRVPSHRAEENVRVSPMPEPKTTGLSVLRPILMWPAKDWVKKNWTIVDNQDYCQGGSVIRS